VHLSKIHVGKKTACSRIEISCTQDKMYNEETLPLKNYHICLQSFEAERESPVHLRNTDVVQHPASHSGERSMIFAKTHILPNFQDVSNRKAFPLQSDRKLPRYRYCNRLRSHDRSKGSRQKTACSRDRNVSTRHDLSILMRPSPHLAMSRESGGSFWNLTLKSVECRAT
jgi:hypothetical protein